jgi:hypothetical protein
VASVNRHGVGCAENTCGNPRLQKYVLDEGRKMGVPVPALDGFRKAMEGATGTTIEEAATELSSFASKNDAEMAANLSKVPAISRMANQLKGYLMEARQNQTDPARGAAEALAGVALAGAVGRRSGAARAARLAGAAWTSVGIWPPRCSPSRAALAGADASPRAGVVTSSKAIAFEPSLAAFRDGFAVAWYDNRDGTASCINRRSTPDGRPARRRKCA